MSEQPIEQRPRRWTDGEQFSTLTFRQREVLELRYGDDAFTREEVGRVFRISEERVRQIEVKAAVKLAAARSKSLPG